MKERLQQLLEMEQLNPSRFADLIGVQRSSVSHILSGRNNPSYDFIQKTLGTFPGLRADWLLLGKGTMYEQMGRANEPDLFSPGEADPPSNDDIPQEKEELIADQSREKSPGTGLAEEPAEEDADPEIREVVQVVIFYSDQTFRTYHPAG